MKYWFVLVAVTLGLLDFAAVWAAERTVTLDVENMSCALCPVTVRKALEAVAGVQTVKVSLADKTAVVTFDDEKADMETLTAATTNAGFPSHPQEQTQ